VLSVISRCKFDLKPMFGTIVETAARLAEADKVILRHGHGECDRVGAYHGFTPEQIHFAEQNAYPPPPGTLCIECGRKSGPTTLRMPWLIRLWYAWPRASLPGPRSAFRCCKTGI
jgi:hypothetical protein